MFDDDRDRDESLSKDQLQFDVIVPCNISFQALADMDDNKQQKEDYQGGERVAHGEEIEGSHDYPKMTKICLMHGCNV